MKPIPSLSSVVLATTLATSTLPAETPEQKLKRPAIENLGGSATLPDTVVTAETPQAAYAAPATSMSGLKLNTRLLETPQAISIVPQALIRDQDARQLDDVIKNVAGVTPGGYYSEWDYYRIRGFDAAFTTYQDGLRGDFDGVGVETFGLERVEVIKGPASSLYGQAPLGGIVNLVSKKPKREFGGEITFTGGMWDYYEGTLDINIPLRTPGAPTPSKDGKSTGPANASDDLGIYFRLLALYDSHSSFVDYYDYQRIFIAPSLTFEWGTDTSLTLLAHYQNDSGLFSMPLPARGTVQPNPNGEIPINRFIGIPGKTGQMDVDTFRLAYEFKHRFNDVVSLRQNAGYYLVEQTWNNILYNAVLDPDDRTLYANPYQYDKGKYQRFMVDTGLDFTFATGSIKHSLTFGADYYYSHQQARYREIDYNDFPGSYVPIDLFDPHYGNLTLPPYATQSSFDAHEHNLGIYLQDHAKLTDKLTLTLGVRQEFLWADDSGSYGSTPLNSTDDAFTPKAGITYEFIPGLAAYANWSRSFVPQWSSRDAAGLPIAPEEGENWEGGLKYDLLGGKVSGLVSVFNLTRQNVATSNLATADPFDATVSGEQRSRGVEFEIAARPVRGLEFTAAYTYLNAEVTVDNDIPVGTPLLGVPKSSVNVWLKYTLQDGPLKGFGFGVGGRYYSSQSADTYHTFDLPAYGLVDAALYYERDRFRAQVNFKNILDKRHFVGSYSDLYVLPGEPFNVSATVGWKF
jgi:iron complex outermembrane receptor protein